MKRLFLSAYFVAVILLLSGAQAQALTIYSNTVDWKESTVIHYNSNNPWPFFPTSLVPDESTFTLTPTAGASHVYNVSGSTNLFSGNGIRFYRTEFNLDPFDEINLDIQLSVDNDIQIWINRKFLAMENSLDTSNFAFDRHHRLFVESSGNVINGYLGGDAFDSVLSSFSESYWNTGENEIILAVRNLTFGDSGGFSFGAEINTVVPEPTTMLLFGTGLIGLAGARRKFRK